MKKIILTAILVLQASAYSSSCSQTKQDFNKAMTSTKLAAMKNDTINAEKYGLISLSLFNKSIKYCGYKKGNEEKAIAVKNEIRVMVIMSHMANFRASLE